MYHSITVCTGYARSCTYLGMYHCHCMYRLCPVLHIPRYVSLYHCVYRLCPVLHIPRYVSLYHCVYRLCPVLHIPRYVSLYHCMYRLCPVLHIPRYVSLYHCVYRLCPVLQRAEGADHHQEGRRLPDPGGQPAGLCEWTLSVG